MTAILGIDGALASSGLLHWQDGKFNAATVHTDPMLSAEGRWSQVITNVTRRVRLDPETLVILEGVFVGGKSLAGTALELAYLHGALRARLYDIGVPFVVVNNQAIKLYATGHGRATKAEMIGETARLGLKFNVGDDHQADALWMVAMTLHHYGLPLCTTSDAGLKALRGIDWPDWIGRQHIKHLKEWGALV